MYYSSALVGSHFHGATLKDVLFVIPGRPPKTLVNNMHAPSSSKEKDSLHDFDEKLVTITLSQERGLNLWESVFVYFFGRTRFFTKWFQKIVTFKCE